MFLEKGTHVMVDLETLSHIPGGAFISIAAQVFSEDSPNIARFRTDIDPDSCIQKGMFPSAGTIGWWMTQEHGVRTTTAKKLLDKTGVRIEEALAQFSVFWDTHCDKNTKLWGNGADFDNPFLTVAYRRCGFKDTPYAAFNGRCFRTVKNVARLNGIGSPYKPTIAHDPASDVEAQVNNMLHYNAEFKKRLRTATP